MRNDRQDGYVMKSIASEDKLLIFDATDSYSSLPSLFPNGTGNHKRTVCCSSLVSFCVGKVCFDTKCDLGTKSNKRY